MGVFAALSFGSSGGLRVFNVKLGIMSLVWGLQHCERRVGDWVAFKAVGFGC